MKSLIFSLLAASVLVFSSCKKDEDCDPGSLNTTIVGTWEVRVLGLHTGDVEFRANGTLIDDSGLFVDTQGFDDKSWVVVSDSRFTIRASDGTNMIESDFDVSSYDCDEIHTDFSGFAVVIARK